MNYVSVMFCDQRSASPPGLFHSEFHAEYHYDTRTPETDTSVIIDRIDLYSVDLMLDGQDMFTLWRQYDITLEIREIVLNVIDEERIKEKVIDSVSSLSSQSFKELY